MTNRENRTFTTRRGVRCAPRRLSSRECPMKANHTFCPLLALMLVLLLLPTGAAAQEPTEGVNWGNYNIKQSVTFGGRFADFTGNKAVYRSFDNLQAGPRLLEYSLEMRSLNHQGSLFDNFFLGSFGYGGDPNAVSRLRAYKNKWYNFSGTFRMNRNQWDYNLLANPLNRTTSNPAFPITFSPHKMELVRRMSDFGLTLLPQSRVRVRLGYSRNISEGPSLNTPRAGTETIVLQGWKTTLNAYSFGIDFKLLPKTNISYDQFLYYFKGDTTWDNGIGTTPLGLPRLFAQLSNGQPVDLGFIFNTVAGQPCAVPITSTATTPPTASATCNSFLLYDLVGNLRNSYPTEQLSFQTSYFKNLDLAGRLSYSSSDNDMIGYRERFDGRYTRTNARQYTITGPAATKRVAVTADFGLTWYVTDKLRVIDSFRFHHFRLPGSFDLSQVSFFGATILVTPNIFTPGAAPPANCATITSPGCPAHNSSSPADVLSQQYSTFLGQDSKFNQFEVAYDFTRRVGARIGYRFRQREIKHASVLSQDLLFFPTLPNRGACAGRPRLPDGSCRAVTSTSGGEEDTINEHTALFALWARPTDQWRFSLDTQLMSADESFTRISPRQEQVYKLRTSYRPASWASIAASFNIVERRNNVAQILHKQHYRTYGFNATFNRDETWALDIGYDFNDIFSQSNICFTLTGTPLPPGSGPCPIVVPAATIQALSFYNHDTHFGYFDAKWKPWKRLTTRLGYMITSTAGETLILAPTAPPGPLRYNYHKPYAGIDLDLSKGVTFHSTWGYYGYNEKAFPGVTTSARDFRGNIVSLSMRYAF